MGRSRRQPVQKYHDRVAGRYDHSYDDDYWRWHDGLTWALIKRYLPRNANAEVIDLGCGTGKWGARVAKSGYPVTGVDISAKMLDQARRKWAPLVGAVAPRLLQADLCAMPTLGDGQFELALAMGDPIGCASDPAAALREIRRVLRPAGVLIASFDNRWAAIDFHLQEGGAEGLRRFLRDGRTHWLTKDSGERFSIFTFGPDDVRKLMRTTGFALVEMEGRTILPMRHHRSLLRDATARRRLTAIERELCRSEASALGRATHLHVVARAG